METEKVIAALRVQSKALEVVHSKFREKGFAEIMPVILSTTTDPLGPDPGSSVIKTPFVEYLGQKLVLTQSMILHKQVLAPFLDKFYIISPNVRLENPKRRESGRHLFEFSQVDFEIAHGTMKDIFALVEDVMTSVIKAVSSECKSELELWGRILKLPKKFKKYTTQELEAKYGKDWEVIKSKASKEPFWTLSHKREFYDAEDPDRRGFYLNYDLVYPEGFGEALSGAEREWDFERLVMRMKRDGFSTKQYEHYLKFAKKGFVPTAGAGFGVERLTRFLVGAKHIGDVQPFRRVPGEKVII